MDGLWVVCLYVVNKVGDLRFELITEFYDYICRIGYCFGVIESCMALVPSLGRGRTPLNQRVMPDFL